MAVLGFVFENNLYLLFVGRGGSLRRMLVFRVITVRLRVEYVSFNFFGG